MSDRDTSSWLPNTLGPLDLEVEGTPVDVPRRSTFNFVGIGVTDDPDNERTVFTPTAATTGAAGSMSAEDKTKLDGIQKQGESQAISALEIDWSLGGVFYKALAAGSNAITFANATDGWCIIVELTGAASTIDWSGVTGLKWPGGVAPTQTASGTDVYTFVKRGSNIYGSVVQDMG